jgi:hypothetical protein
MWLRDLLPELIPNVRIMTYGYNAKFRNFTGHQDLRNIAAKLLAELVDLRESEEVPHPLSSVALLPLNKADQYRKWLVLSSSYVIV